MTGDTVRFRQGRFWVTGTVLAIGDSLIVTERSGKRQATRLSASSEIERPVGRGSSLGQGLTIGGLVGMLAGGIVGAIGAPDCLGEWLCFGPELYLAGGAVAGLLGGAAAGAVIGALVPRTIWRPVEVGGERVVVTPRIAGSSVGLQASLRLSLR